jgi:hypothetical protein
MEAEPILDAAPAIQACILVPMLVVFGYFSWRLGWDHDSFCTCGAPLKPGEKHCDDCYRELVVGD